MAEKADSDCEKTCERHLIAYSTHDTSQQDVNRPDMSAHFKRIIILPDQCSSWALSATNG